MIPFLLSGVAACGVTLLLASNHRPDAHDTLETASDPRQSRRSRLETWLRQAGLVDVNAIEFIAVSLVLATGGAMIGFGLFGGILPALVLAVFAATFPASSYRVRRQARRQRSHEAWPRLIEQIRVQTGSVGRSIPNALFEVGCNGPQELRPAFEAAHRHWLLTTDLRATLNVLKGLLADPSADMVAETLLIAHELGGSDLSPRLAALAEDRRQEVQGRKDARARQAGARFARLFVLAVPAGMAMAGLSIGNGRAAFGTPLGQAIAVFALLIVILCWVWAGRVMRLPETKRVFVQ